MKVVVSKQGFRVRRTLGFDAFQAAAQRLELLFNYFAIHAIRLSANMRSIKGMKSA